MVLEISKKKKKKNFEGQNGRVVEKSSDDVYTRKA